MLFENEKERARWQLEKDNLLNLKNELQESFERLSLKKDSLMRENEKLRAESKNRKLFF